MGQSIFTIINYWTVVGVVFKVIPIFSLEVMKDFPCYKGLVSSFSELLGKGSSIFQNRVFKPRRLKKWREWWGYTPIIILEREGPHMGALEWALRKATPDCASLLMLGVKVCGWPLRGSMQSLRSSIMMSNTLGFSFTDFSQPEMMNSTINKRPFNKRNEKRCTERNSFNIIG